MDDRAFYAKLAPFYDEFYGFPERTLGDVTFVGWALGDPEPATTRLIDVACGTGRHLVEFARAGYQVEGLDLSEDMLQYARGKLAAEALSAPLRIGDMRDFTVETPVHGVTCLLSAIAHMLTDEDLAAALSSFRRALAPKGVCVVDTINVLSLLERFQPTVDSLHPIEGGYLRRTVRHGIDMVEAQMIHDEYVLQATGEGAQGWRYETRLRLFTWPELRRAFRDAGFASAELYADANARTPATRIAHRLLIVARP